MCSTGHTVPSDFMTGVPSIKHFPENIGPIKHSIVIVFLVLVLKNIFLFYLVGYWYVGIGFFI